MAGVVCGWVFLVGFLTPLLPCEGDNVPLSPRVRSRVRTTVHVIPWVEVNELNEALLTTATTGLRSWSRVTDTAIVSTSPGRSAVLRNIKNKITGMRIVPGIKTWTLLPTFDSPSGWRAVALEVAEVSEAARETVVVLDNETAMKPYLQGKQEINLAVLRESLRQLPPNIRIVWYPSVHGDGAIVQKRYQDVCRAVEEVCDVRFVDLSMSGPKSIGTKWSAQVQQRLREVATEQTMPLLHFYGVDRWWLDDQLEEALRVVERDFGKSATAIVYPGFDRWVQASEVLTAQLEPTGVIDKPDATLLKVKPSE